jgi:hypothetical protein
MAEITRTIEDEIIDFLISTPDLEQIAAFHASDTAQARLRYLLEANRNGTLTDSEREELDDASYLNHFISRLKTRARKAMENS